MSTPETTPPGPTGPEPTPQPTPDAPGAPTPSPSPSGPDAPQPGAPETTGGDLGEAEVQETFDVADEKGYFGVRVDPFSPPE